MDNAMVSVVIPLYNKAAHIQRAIDSVLAQTCGDFELIGVDDGSTDGSGDIVRRYTDPRIRLITQENAGVSAARNRGVADAKAELVAFLDGDDEWMLDLLETVLALRTRFPQAAVWGAGYVKITPAGEYVQEPLREEVCQSVDGLLIDFFRESLVCQPIHMSTMLVNKNALSEIGGFRTKMAYGEDTDLWFRLALRYPFAYMPGIKAIYHQDAEKRSDWECHKMSGVPPFIDEVRI